jgi:hypothetical protein
LSWLFAKDTAHRLATPAVKVILQISLPRLLGRSNLLQMPNHDDISSRAGDGWDKQRTWKAVVKLAEVHQKLQASYSLLLTFRNTNVLRNPDVTDAAEG